MRRGEEARAAEVRSAFGELSDAALAGLAGATPEQKARIEQFILEQCYPAHYVEEPTAAMLDAGQHALSEWLNDNAPIGARRYREPAKAAWQAMRRAARGEVVSLDPPSERGPR